MLQCQQHLLRVFCVAANIRDNRSQGVFLHKWHHVPCVISSSIIPSISTLNIWKCWGLIALLIVPQLSSKITFPMIIAGYWIIFVNNTKGNSALINTRCCFIPRNPGVIFLSSVLSVGLEALSKILQKRETHRLKTSRPSVNQIAVCYSLLEKDLILRLLLKTKHKNKETVGKLLNVFECIYNLWIEFGTAVARCLKPSQAAAV